MPGHPMTQPPCGPFAQVTGLILAGGQGRRLGGVDKGLLELDGRPLVQHLAQRLAGQVYTLLLSANRHLERYRALGFDPLTDGPYQGAGPLAGLRAGLAVCTTPWLLAAPCDMPSLPADLCVRLWQAAPADDARARVPFDGQRHHYACLLLPRSALGPIEAALAAGRHCLRELLADIGWLGVDFATAGTRAFSNLNTPADLARFAETP